MTLLSCTIKNSRARQLFILADGKRSLSQIFNMVKVEAQEGLELVRLMLEHGCLDLSKNSFSLATQISPVTTGDTDQMPVADFVGSVTVELAKYIGPVASLIMGDFELPENQIDRVLREHIIDTVSKEIDQADERKLFLAATKNVNKC